ncbi:uncharacterized protein J7T54_007458 [Emericellopsis cladophorae]|uniref:Early meiotic induction protein 1 n=1 Tax=Emericellopsis cladophorae TaxID=2686198 RepID=A0A9Q0BBS1_9HYPO|nr:uncharacterized protein J7T54_007458 [Emericellopsis cladophorae]KAI6778805.1 hypothetical protein J7T54_007458 [Emericellopsis cladophorae]
MGWLWASGSPKEPTAPPADKAATTTTASPSTSTPRTAPNEPSMDPEIQKFFDLFNNDGKKPEAPTPAQKSSPTSSSTSQAESESKSSWFTLKASKSIDPASENAPPRDPLSEALLPTEMSCRQAFDLAWACNSLGGQFNAVYRNGEMRSCSQQWDDFWFCMRTKSHTGAVKADAVRQHYRNKEYEKYYKPGARSSEDIWQSRDWVVRDDEVFTQAFDASTQRDDDEWRRNDNERRRQLRESLGIDKPASAS